ncbi:MAG: zinc-dependent metalloprotease [Bacteroidota bacterium]
MALGDFAISGDFEYFKVVKVADLRQLITERKTIDVLPPGTNYPTSTVRIKDIHPERNGDHVIRMQVADDATSTVVLRRSEGLLYGTVRLHNESYTLLGIEPGLGLLYRRGHSVAGHCKEEKSKGGKPTEQSSGLEKTCRNNVFRILVLYTNRGANAAGNRAQLANAAIDLLNDMLANSGAVLSAELAGVEDYFNFVETDDVFDDSEDLNIGVFSNDIQDLRARFGADQVVVLTDGTMYGGVIGIAAGIGPANQNAAIVQVGAALEEFTFSHEVGHMLGGRHEVIFPVCGGSANLNTNPFVNLNSDVTPGQNHAFIFDKCRWPGRDFAAVTVMMSNSALDGPFVRGLGWNVDYLPEFSNLGVAPINLSPYLIVPGVANQANNTGTFDANANAITNLEDQCAFTAAISGMPFVIVPGQTLFLSASSAGCAVGTVTYEWSVSTNGFNFTTVGSGSTVTVNVPATQGTGDLFFVQLDARCDNADGNPNNDPTARANGLGIINCLFCLTDSETPNNKAAELDYELGNSSLITYPNPVKRGDILTVNIPKPEENWQLQVFDLTGRQLSSQVIPKDAPDRAQLRISTEFPSVVIVRLLGTESFTKKIIIQ